MKPSKNLFLKSVIVEFILLGGLALALFACGRDPVPVPVPPPSETAPPIPEVFRLRPEIPQRHDIADGEIHVYPLDLGTGEYVRLEVEQLDTDVYLELSGPAGARFPRIDSPIGSTGVEPIFLVTAAAGAHCLRIRTFEPGRYEVRLDRPRPAGREDRRQAEAHRAYYEARHFERRKDPELAAEMYREAAGLWRGLGDEEREARALFDFSLLRPRSAVDQGQRIDALDRAAKLFERVGDRLGAAQCLHRLGGLWSRRRDPETARDLYARSLAHWRDLGASRDAAIVAADLGDLYRRLGRPEQALDLFHEALDLIRQTGDVLDEAMIRTRLGSLYHYRGETPRAVREYRQALLILDRHPRPGTREKHRRTVTSTRLGQTLPFLQGSPRLEEALERLEEARELRLELGDRRGMAITVGGLGLVYEKMGRPQLAIEAFREALGIFRELGRVEDEAVALTNLCRVLPEGDKRGVLPEGDPRGGDVCYLEALSLARQVGYQNIEAEILFGLARIARRHGELHVARTRIESALEALELIRREAGRGDLRSSFLARKYAYYELAVDIALELHERDPEAGHADVAFRDLERARARGFLDTLVRIRPELDRQADPAVLRRLEELRAAIHRLEMERLALPDDAKAELTRLEGELGDLLDRLHQASPRYAALVEPRILSSREVGELLDADTLLLEYHLGEEHGAVWAVTETATVLRRLPPKVEIERVARDLHEAMSSQPHRIRGSFREVDKLREELSRMILEPVADLLDRPRLAIVASGALGYVPFAALPHPATLAGSGPPRPLLLTHRITSTPSASVLAVLRARHAERTPPEGLLALLAAPVLGPDDERLRGRASPDPGDAPLLPDALLTPLPYAAVEAEAVLGLVEGEDVLPALGFAAARDVVFGGDLGNYRYLHFATHGHLDDAHGELSALVLSQFDARGNRVDGVLRAYEVYQLDLRADLVVLSACQTALGEEIRGEGLTGLTRGFLYAGADRVLVSLWSVSDMATARLMEHFYRGLLEDGLHPAEALRRAQVELHSEDRWRAPYFWAPFVLQGDWSSSADPIGRPR